MSDLLLISLLGASLILGQTFSSALKDPTQPPDYMQTVSPNGGPVVESLVLQEVLTEDDRRVALINEQLVGEGDWVDGAQVLKIQPYSALLSRDGVLIALDLTQEVVKNPVENETVKSK